MPYVSTRTGTLAVVLRRGDKGAVLTREPVRDADLHDARAEAWLAGYLRKGSPGVPLQDAAFRVVPQARGFALDAMTPGHKPTRCQFSASALSPVVTRAVERLVEQGTLSEGDTYSYDLAFGDESPDEPDPAPEPFTAVVTVKPLDYVSIPVTPLRQRARAVGKIEERTYPVFYTEAAYARAEKFARKGAGRTPAVETGGMLIGPLCSCPETGEFFAVVEEVLEVTDAEEGQFSLSYSGKTWARFQAILKARQARPATRAHRLLGQCHGHNFLPADGAPPCELCSTTEVCTRTSVFVSADDRLWSRAVFGTGQPWQLCHIFGLNARREEVQGLFGLRDGRLQERGFQVIPEFPG